MRRITIMHYPAQPHFFSYGGFDIQMNRVIDMTNNREVTSKKVNLWSHNEIFEIAHFWGASDAHKLNIRFCRENGIKVVISGLFPQKTFLGKYKSQVWRIIHKFAHCESVIYNADIITVINEAQAEVVNEYYGYPKERIRIIPTILDDYIFSNKINTDIKENYILCVGTICDRKNQITLANAAIKFGIKCVFVGRFDSREQKYKENFQKIYYLNKEFIEHYQNISIAELVDLYSKCNMVACLSQNETEPASMLEGMYFKKPIIASDLPFAKIKKFSGVVLCDQNDIQSIIKAIEIADSSEGEIEYQFFNRTENFSGSVVDLYTKLYKELVQ